MKYKRRATLPPADAILWDGENLEAVKRYFRDLLPPKVKLLLETGERRSGICLFIDTTQHSLIVRPGRWIVCEDGELYTLPSDGFAERFEPA